MKRATAAEVSRPSRTSLSAVRNAAAGFPSASDLNAARYATPGSVENRAYHAKLDEIHRMAIEIRAKREGR